MHCFEKNICSIKDFIIKKKKIKKNLRACLILIVMFEQLFNHKILFYSRYLCLIYKKQQLHNLKYLRVPKKPKHKQSVRNINTLFK